MVIKDLDLNQQHHPLLNACRSLASTLHNEVTWHSTHLRLTQLIERFPRLKLLLIILNKYGETIDLYDSKTLEQIPFESFDLIFSANQLLGNQDLTNSLISLRRLLVPNGLLLLLELVHIPLYFDLIFGFNDQWWSSDDNNRALNNIQQ
ncbi:unnamed protein product [Adineta steineri]|uniref:Uncharacterized protein n=1 Tax=Adineta steineri TaxID=433720 RepID=A0A814KTJ6_9BILA|nr:unnamed protein product [Adineta steineri]CAF1166965.1 unnamed protein product [Adineta steineri]